MCLREKTYKTKRSLFSLRKDFSKLRSGAGISKIRLMQLRTLSRSGSPKSNMFQTKILRLASKELVRLLSYVGASKFADFLGN